MIIESVASFLNIFNPSRSPFYAVTFICALSFILTVDQPLEIAIFVIMISYPLILIFNYSCYFSKASNDAETLNSELIFSRTIGVVSSIISLIILVSSSSVDETDGEFVYKSFRFAYIYIAILVNLIIFGTLLFWCKKSVLLDKERDFRQVSLTVSILLITSSILGTSLVEPKTAEIYFSLLINLYWINLIACVFYLKR